MITGQYVHSHGYYANHGRHRDWPIWLPAHLRGSGYETAMIGKAHYGYEKTTREFDFVRLCDRIDTPPDDPLKNEYFRNLVKHGRADDDDAAVSMHRDGHAPFRSHLPKELTYEW